MLPTGDPSRSLQLRDLSLKVLDLHQDVRLRVDALVRLLLPEDGEPPTLDREHVPVPGPGRRRAVHDGDKEALLRGTALRFIDDFFSHTVKRIHHALIRHQMSDGILCIIVSILEIKPQRLDGLRFTLHAPPASRRLYTKAGSARSR